MATTTSTPSRPAQAPQPSKARLLSGAGGGAARKPGSTITATTGTTFTATVPFERPQQQPSRRPPAQAAKPQGLPRWAKGVVIGGVLVAVAMPVSVLMSRSMLVQAALAEESGSKAAMVCTAGDAHAVDDSGVMGWLFGGSYFRCGDWETREARVQRERDQAQANYMARERAKQGLN